MGRHYIYSNVSQVTFRGQFLKLPPISPYDRPALPEYIVDIVLVFQSGSEESLSYPPFVVWFNNVWTNLNSRPISLRLKGSFRYRQCLSFYLELQHCADTPDTRYHRVGQESKT